MIDNDSRKSEWEVMGKNFQIFNCKFSSYTFDVCNYKNSFFILFLLFFSSTNFFLNFNFTEIIPLLSFELYF